MERASSLLLRSAALPLALQHSSLHSDPAAIIRFMETSKLSKAAVLQHCRGVLHLPFAPRNEQHLAQYAEWLKNHAQLLGCLQLCPPETDGFTFTTQKLWQTTESLVARALQQCAQLYGLLLVKHLIHGIAYQDAGSILKTISPESLQVLQLHCSWYRSKVCIHSCNLSAFSKLQVLGMSSLTEEGAALVVAAIPSLSNLKDLSLGGAFTPAQMTMLQQQLPSGLISLALTISTEGGTLDIEPPYFPLQLQQLPSLQSLSIESIHEDCQLPQQLLHLRCRDCSTVDPLLLCTQLQQLEIYWANRVADELSKLSVLTSLSNISLSFPTSAHGACDKAAAAFSQLPFTTALRQLEVGLEGSEEEAEVMQSSTLQDLHWLSGLTLLKICVAEQPLPVSPEELGSALQRLTSLQQLELYADPGPHLLQPVLQEPPAVAVTLVDAAKHVLTILEHGLLHVVGDLVSPELAAAVAAAKAAVNYVEDIPAVMADEQPDLVQELQQYAEGLQLHMQEHQEQPEPEEVAPDMRPLTEAISGLPGLISLKLKGHGLDLEAVEPLTKATQLTRLTMSGLGFDDLALIKLAFNLTGLQRLSLSDSEERVTDAGLLVVGQTLKQLTELELTNCIAVTDKGVAQLTGLRYLSVLDIMGAVNVSSECVETLLRAVSEQQ